MESQTKTQIEYGQSNINLSIDMSLQESFKSAWPDSISSFITEYGLNPGNFRMWLNGKNTVICLKLRLKNGYRKEWS